MFRLTPGQFAQCLKSKFFHSPVDKSWLPVAPGHLLSTALILSQFITPEVGHFFNYLIADEHSTPQRLSFIDDPLSTQRLSFISADGSEIDSDYSSASSIIHVSDEQKNLE